MDPEIHPISYGDVLSDPVWPVQIKTDTKPRNADFFFGARVYSTVFLGARVQPVLRRRLV